MRSWEKKNADLIAKTAALIETQASSGFLGHEFYVRRCIELGHVNVGVSGRPFSCLIVDNATGEILAEAGNQVAQTGDPTAHAEVVAIREASAKLRQRRAPADIDLTNGGFGEDLRGHNIYILTNPCPMCAAAMGYCGADAIVHATTRAEYSNFYRDDRRHVSMETFGEATGLLCRPQPVSHLARQEAVEVYRAWRAKNAANLPTGVSLGWKGDEAYAARVVQLNGGCVVVNMATGEALAEVAHETGTSLSPVIQAYIPLSQYEYSSFL